MTRIWIVRHGNTFRPDEMPRRIGARTDLPLVASGRAQACALRDWFAAEGVRFDGVLAGALRRTCETAAIIADRGALIESAGWLTEIDHGPDEGRSEADVLARIGAGALEAWDRDATPPAGWIVDRESRIAGWRQLFHEARQPGRRLLVVTSNGAARFAFAADPGLRRQATRLPSLKLRTGAFGQLASDGGAIEIEAWDRRP